MKRYFNNNYFAAFLLICLSSLFFPSLFNDYLWDDKAAVLGNYFLTDPGSLIKAFFNDYWALQPLPLASGYYRPLSLISFVLSTIVAGNSAFVQHLLSLLLHLANSYLLYLLFLPFFKQRFYSLAIALLFLIHPATSEVPLFISARPDCLALFFVLLSFIFFSRYWQSSGQGSLFAAVASFFLALLSKESAVFALLLLPCYYYLLAANSDRRKKKLPLKILLLSYLAPLALVLLLRTLVVGSPLSRANIAPEYWPTLLSLPRVFFFYLKTLVFPLELAAIYDFSLSRSIFEFSFIVHFIFLLGFLLTLYLIRRKKLLFFAALWLCLSLLPYLNIVPFAVILANRYLYFALPGFLLLVVAGGQLLLERFVRENKRLPLFAGAFLLLAIFYGYLLLQQISVFKDDCSLWRANIEQSKNSAVVHNNLGNCFLADKDYLSAASYYRRAIDLSKNFYLEAELNLARVELQRGQLQQSQERLELIKAKIGTNPELFDLLGSLYAALNDWPNCYRYSLAAFHLAPKNRNYIFNLAVAQLQLKKGKEALPKLRYLTEVDPNFTSAWLNLAAANTQLGNNREALANYQRAIKLAPWRLDIYLNYIVVRLRLGEREQALIAYRSYLNAGGKMLDFSLLERRANLSSNRR